MGPLPDTASVYSDCPDDMASGICNPYDPDPRPHHHAARWTEDGEDDWKSLPESHRAHWTLLQFVADLR